MILNNQFIEAFILSGAIGMVQYWILREFELLNFFKHENSDEKASLVLILTFIHLFFNSMITQATDGRYRMLLYFIFSFVISLIISFILLNVLAWGLKNWHEHNTKYRKPFNTYIPIFQEIVEKDIDEKDNYIVVFNMNNEIVEHGYLHDYSLDNNQIELKLRLVNWEDVETDFSNFRKSLGKNVYVFISAKNNMKIYIFKNDKASK